MHARGDDALSAAEIEDDGREMMPSALESRWLRRLAPRGG